MRIDAKHVADLAVAVSLPYMFIFIVVIHKSEFVKAPNRHFDYLLAVRHDNAFFGHEVG
ncbi:hypothetical protein D3C84_1312490 [compost metagenome]